MILELPMAPPLRLVFWETTAGCNLECAHCRRLEVSKELMRNDLTTEEGRSLINQIAAVGRPVLVLSGGEPLMRPDIFDLAAHAKNAGLLVALATNGTMIDPPLAERIAQTGFDRVSVSLDGSDATTHDRFRGQVGSFGRSMQALGHLRTAGVATQINCTIARHNQHQLGEILELGKRTGAVAVHYFLLVPVGCGEQIAEDQMLSTAEVEKRLLEIYQLEQGTSLQIKATCAPHYYRIIRQQGRIARRASAPRHADQTSSGDAAEHAQTPGHPAGHPHTQLHSVSKGCLAGTAVCFVSHDGQVFPCGYLPVACGDIRHQNFGDIWRENPVFADLRNPQKLTGKCGACEFKTVCSGCRARAFHQYGDLLAEEPYCEYLPRPEPS